MCHVLVLSADRPVLESSIRVLRDAGHRPLEAASVLEATQRMIRGEVECVVLHEKTAGYFQEFVRELREKSPRMGVVIVTVDALQAEEEYAGLDVWSVLPSSATPETLKEKVAGAYEFAAMSDTRFHQIEREIEDAAAELKTETNKIKKPAMPSETDSAKARRLLGR